MTSNKEIIGVVLAIMIISIAGVFIINTYAFGETITNTTETIDQNVIPFSWQGKLCGWDDTETKWLCEYDPNRINLENITDTTIPNVITGSTTTCPDRFYLAEDGVTCLPEIEDAPVVIPPTYREKELIPYEKALEKLLEIEEPDAKEREAIALFENLGECRAGYGPAAGVFEDRWFPISYTWINDGEAWVKAFDYGGLHKQIKLNIAECFAIRTQLNPVILGQWYQDRADAELEYPKLSHTERASHIPIVTAERVNIEANKNIEKTEYDICDYVAIYSKQTRDYYGCNAFPQVITNGFVTYANEIEDRWLEYLADGGAAQAKESMKRLLDQKTRDLRTSSEISHRGLE